GVGSVGRGRGRPSPSLDGCSARRGSCYRPCCRRRYSSRANQFVQPMSSEPRTPLFENLYGSVPRIWGIDLRALAAFRVGLGVLLLVDLVARSLHLVAHYTDAGVLPRAALAELQPGLQLSLHTLSGSAAWQSFSFSSRPCVPWRSSWATARGGPPWRRGCFCSRSTFGIPTSSIRATASFF